MSEAYQTKLVDIFLPIRTMELQKVVIWDRYLLQPLSSRWNIPPALERIEVASWSPVVATGNIDVEPLMFRVVIGLCSQMPLAHESGSITGFPHGLGNGHLFQWQVRITGQPLNPFAGRVLAQRCVLFRVADRCSKVA